MSAPPPPEVIVRVVAPHFVAGLVLENGRVVKAAPILRWAVGRTLPAIEQYCYRRQWILERVKRLER